MLGSSYFSEDSFKSLTEVIGDMSVLWRDYDANLTSQKKSIADIILDLKERHDETSEDSNN